MVSVTEPFWSRACVMGLGNVPLNVTQHLKSCACQSVMENRCVRTTSLEAGHFVIQHRSLSLPHSEERAASHTHKLINHSWYVSHCASKTLIYSLIKYKYKYKYDYCKESEPVWWRCLTVLCCTSDFRGDCG